MCCFSCFHTDWHLSPYTAMPVNMTVYKYAMLHTNTSSLLSMSIQAICQNFFQTLRVLLFASQNCLHTCLCICGHQICCSYGSWVLARCSVSQGAQSSMKMLYFRIDGLLQRARDPERMIPSVAFQRLTSAWRVAFRGRFHGSLIFSHLNGDWLIDWVDVQCLPTSDSRVSTASGSSALVSQRGACQVTSEEDVPELFQSMLEYSYDIFNYMENCVFDVLTFLTKWLWRCTQSQPKSPDRGFYFYIW